MIPLSPTPAIPGRTRVPRFPGPPAQHTSFVGREHELAAIRALLSRDEVRLLTLLGPGGIGKTRLAIQVAEALDAAFPDGIAYVALAGIREPSRLFQTISQTLSGPGMSNQDQPPRPHRLLENRSLLLLLDNVEHLTSATAPLAELLSACPGLKLLVTSCSPLRLSGEHEYLVPPLALPALDDRISSDSLLRSDAVHLFLQRASAARADFVASADDLLAIARLCHHLDGMPLAIELAASRMTHLSPQAMLDRFNREARARLTLLTEGRRDRPARQQTLRHTIAWTHELLDGHERAIFQRLAIFPDGFTVDAAAAVCGLEADHTLDRIGSLIGKSLVRFQGDRDGEPRYRMYETIREFGLEQLEVSGNDVDARQRHATWALALAETHGPRAKEPGGATWIATLDREQVSLHAALTWFEARGDDVRLSRMVGALWPYWEERARYAEARHWLEAALDPGSSAPPEDRFPLLIGAGTMARHQADFAHGIARHEEALALARARGDREAEAASLNLLGAQYMDLGDFDAARMRFETCIAIARHARLPQLEVRALHNLAQIQRVRHEGAAALSSLAEVLRLARERHLDWIVPSILSGLALAAADLGDCQQAITLFHECLGQAVAKGNLGGVVDGIEGLARVAAIAGQAREAARLFGAGEGLREHLAFPLSPTEIAYAAPVMTRLRDELDADELAATWAQGRSMPQQEAISAALALQVDTCPGLATARRHFARAHGLTEREHEILCLIAAGQGNREIAAGLFISYATVARHVANLFDKLGVKTRSKAMVYAREHGICVPLAPG